MIPTDAAQKISDGLALAAKGCAELAQWAQDQPRVYTAQQRGACADQRFVPSADDVEETTHVAIDEESASATQIPVEDPIVTLEQLRGLLSRLSLEGHGEAVRALIRSMGVEKLSDVPPDKYVELMELALEVSDA